MVIPNLILTALVAAAMATATVSEKGQARIAKEVRHEILMLPYFDVFENIEFRVDGYNVTLMGHVTRPTRSGRRRAVAFFEFSKRANAWFPSELPSSS